MKTRIATDLFGLSGLRSAKRCHRMLDEAGLNLPRITWQLLAQGGAKMRRSVFPLLIVGMLVVLAILTGSLTQVAKADPGCPYPWTACSQANITLSSADAPACSDDSKASCASSSFVGSVPAPAHYSFDCSGVTLEIKVPIKIWGLIIYVPIPTPACTLFALGSKFTVTEVSPNGQSTKILEKVYTGLKNEGQFDVKTNYTYKLYLNAHGRDYRDALHFLKLGTFDSSATVSFETGSRDNIPPTCTATYNPATDKDPYPSVTFTLQDRGTGLSNFPIGWDSSVNPYGGIRYFTDNVSFWTPVIPSGTTGPVTLQFWKNDRSRTSRVGLWIWDLAGNGPTKCWLRNGHEGVW